MENTMDETHLGSLSDVTCYKPPYDEYDKPTLIAILSKKDEIIQKKTDDYTRLQTEIHNLKENNRLLLEEVKRLSNDRCNDKEDVRCAIEVGEETEFGSKPMPDWSLSLENDIALSISEVVRATAEAELNCIESQPENANTITDSGLLINGKDTDLVDNEYVYDSSSGFYYHPSTGYYWDPTSGLFYDYTTCTYYQYNEISGEYEVHSQVDMDITQNITSQNTRKTKHLISSLNKSSYAKTLRSLKTKKASGRKYKKKRRKNKRPRGKNKSDDEGTLENYSSYNLRQKVRIKKKDCQEQPASADESSESLATDESELKSDPESGEIISSSSSDVEMIGEETTFGSSDTVEVYTSEPKPYEEAMADNYPPCIRVIVQESEKLCAGTLFIVTCAGGTIGRDTTQKHSVEIPDICVSKNHASIEYDYDNSCYKVADLGSQNGTSVNGKKLVNSAQPLSHEDVLELGNSSKLLLHIHKGHETCEECEPGLIQAKLKALNPVKNTHVVMSKEERMQHRKKELKKIKKKYGLQNCAFENVGAVISNPDYADKAHLRRKFIGSDNDSIIPDVIPASVHRPIASSNKGHQLLARMGWKEGQGLGKANTGINEPLNVGLRVNQSSGLGSVEGQSVSLDHVHDSSKAKRWNQARQRFNQLQTFPLDHTSDDLMSKTNHASHNCVKNSISTSQDLSENFQCDNNNVVSPPPSSSLSSSLSLPLHSSSSSKIKATGAISKPKPQLKWHKGDTEILSNPNHSENKDS